jgi:hypothetical protein
MDSFKDSLAYWSSILGTALGLLGFIESTGWLAIASLAVLTASIAVLFYARQQRLRLRLATVRIEGRSIDSLNLANLRRRLNRSLVVQEADQVVTIDGDDASATWRYRGYCQASREFAVQFSIDAETYIPYERLECSAYDLTHDPKRLHRIRPVLLGPDGLSKKLAVPFLEHVSARQPFDILLECRFPHSMESGIEYFASTASVAQDRIPACSVRLIFLNDPPAWLRVYECDASGKTMLLKDLRPSRDTTGPIEYADLATNVSAQTARIYMFQRIGGPTDRLPARPTREPLAI